MSTKTDLLDLNKQAQLARKHLLESINATYELGIDDVTVALENSILALERAILKVEAKIRASSLVVYSGNSIDSNTGG